MEVGVDGLDWQAEPWRQTQSVVKVAGDDICNEEFGVVDLRPRQHHRPRKGRGILDALPLLLALSRLGGGPLNPRSRARFLDAEPPSRGIDHKHPPRE